MIEVKISDNHDPVECYTISEAARACNRSRHQFKKLIGRGIMPDANYRLPADHIDPSSPFNSGIRLYTGFLVSKLKPIFTNIKQGRRITAEQKKAFADAFLEERTKYE